MYRDAADLTVRLAGVALSLQGEAPACSFCNDDLRETKKPVGASQAAG